ncbi:uncharacterized protein LOC106160930 [Lingula anatina]|uniref:Uncharacterized protein LOC106160930 n=1 Tax=Lingula anatina TaxID=7574 RepID=A0A1S3I4G2_LINAN|nr:uncharacterized protein LOC106160930 [Lingula anatina]|eukprot:XP_013393155.2 uncharacterized protein LOC106160930 [Lingula anatina]
MPRKRSGSITTIRVEEFLSHGKPEVGYGNGNAVHATEVTQSQSEIYQLFKPFLALMSVLGLYHERRSGAKVHDAFLSDKKNSTAKLNWWKVYGVVAVVVLWLNAVRGFTAFDGSESLSSPFVFFKVLYVAYYIYCALLSTLCFHMCNQEDGLGTFWQEVAQLEHEIPTIVKANGLRRVISVSAAFAIIFVLFNFVYMLSTTVIGAQFPFFFTPFDRFVNMTVMTTESGLVLGFTCLVGLIMSGAAYASVALFVCVCYVHYCSFREFNAEFKEAVKHSIKSERLIDLETYRRKHQKICRLMEISDDLFSAFVAFTLVFSTGLLCLLIYILIYHFSAVTSSVINIIAFTIWISQFILQLTLISMGAFVNHQAHSPLSELHDIQLDPFKIDQLIPFQMFLNKLSVNPIGFSALGLFTIDKPTILTIIGMVLTYFFLMIQFQPSIGSSSDSTGLPSATNTSSAANATVT